MITLRYLAAPALLAVAATGLAVPASAANFSNGNDLRREIVQLDRQVDRLYARDRISRREAAKLDARVDMLHDTWRGYARGGFDRGEIRLLSARIDAVRRDLARQTFDRNDRAYNDRRDDRFDQQRGTYRR